MHRESRITIYGTTPIAVAVMAVGTVCSCTLVTTVGLGLLIAGLTAAFTVDHFSDPAAD